MRIKNTLTTILALSMSTILIACTGSGDNTDSSEQSIEPPKTVNTTESVSEETETEIAVEVADDETTDIESDNVESDNVEINITSENEDTASVNVWGDVNTTEYVDEEYGIHFFLPSDLAVTVKDPLYNQGIVNRSYYVTGLGMNDEYLCQTQKCSDAIYNDSDAPEDELHGEIAHIDGYHYSINFINPDTQYDFVLSDAMVDFIQTYRQKILDSAYVEGTESDITDDKEVQSVTEEESDTTSPSLSNEEIVELARKHSGAPLADLDSIDENGILTIHLYEDMGDHTATWDWYEIDPGTLKGKDFLGNEVDLTCG